MLVSLTTISEQAILSHVSKLAREHKIRYSAHAEMRINQPDRNMPLSKVYDILTNPCHMVSCAYNRKHKEYIYLIQGGTRNRHVVLVIKPTYLFIITVY